MTLTFVNFSIFYLAALAAMEAEAKTAAAPAPASSKPAAATAAATAYGHGHGHAHDDDDDLEAAPLNNSRSNHAGVGNQESHNAAGTEAAAEEALAAQLRSPGPGHGHDCGADGDHDDHGHGHSHGASASDMASAAKGCGEGKDCNSAACKEEADMAAAIKAANERVAQHNQAVDDQVCHSFIHPLIHCVPVAANNELVCLKSLLFKKTPTSHFLAQYLFFSLFV